MNKKNLKYHIQANIKASKISKGLSKSAYGYDLSNDIFAGLPASNMKGKWIQFTVHPSNRPNAVVPIGDIGPWNGGGWNGKYDDPYWRKKHRPEAESGKDMKGNKTDKSGIQLSFRLWNLLELGTKKSAYVDWHFVVSPKNKKAIIVKRNGKRNTYWPTSA